MSGKENIILGIKLTNLFQSQNNTHIIEIFFALIDLDYVFQLETSHLNNFSWQ